MYDISKWQRVKAEAAEARRLKDEAKPVEPAVNAEPSVFTAEGAAAVYARREQEHLAQVSRRECEAVEDAARGRRRETALAPLRRGFFFSSTRRRGAAILEGRLIWEVFGLQLFRPQIRSGEIIVDNQSADSAHEKKTPDGL